MVVHGVFLSVNDCEHVWKECMVEQKLQGIFFHIQQEITCYCQPFSKEDFFNVSKSVSEFFQEVLGKMLFCSLVI